MKSTCAILSFILVASVACWLLEASSDLGSAATGQAGQPQEVSPSGLARKRFQLPRLFDFSSFCQLFKKSYSSMIERLIRGKIYLARAARSFSSAIKYKYNLSSYYLKVNHMSDWTPDEIDALRIGHDQSASKKGLGPMPVADLEEIEAELQVIRAKSSEAGYAEIAEELEPKFGSRNKRSAAPSGLRDISIDDLLSSPDEDRQEPPEVLEKMKDSVPSNNPLYVPPDLASFGDLDDTDDLEKRQNPKKSDEELLKMYEESIKAEDFGGAPLFNPNDNSRTKLADSLKMFDSLVGQLRGSSSMFNAKGPSKSQDLVWVDHRKSGCFFTPRNQGNCGACYAFAYVALMEFLYCKETGQTVQFSEQYMIDCGVRTGKMFGCNGGFMLHSGRFSVDYGIELRNKYPYRMRQDECPYEKDMNPGTMGYLRPGASKTVQVPLRLLPSYLEKTPLVIGIATQGDFIEYGGGVHNGENCGDRLDHIVLLVGHGRQDGEDYWLIRNSHSPTFGEGGYYKLAKRANCIFEAGYFIGVDTKNAALRTKANELNRSDAVRRRYIEYLTKENAKKVATEPPTVVVA